jgi:hypothetical protein
LALSQGVANPRFHHQKYQSALNMILANLRAAQLEDRWLSVSTKNEAQTRNNPDKIKPRTVNNCLEYLSESGLINLDRGRYVVDGGGYPTTCYPTYKLVAWFEINKIRPLLHDKALLVELREKKTKVVERADDWGISLLWQSAY